MSPKIEKNDRFLLLLYIMGLIFQFLLIPLLIFSNPYRSTWWNKPIISLVVLVSVYNLVLPIYLFIRGLLKKRRFKIWFFPSLNLIGFFFLIFSYIILIDLDYQTKQIIFFIWPASLVIYLGLKIVSLLGTFRLLRNPKGYLKNPILIFSLVYLTIILVSYVTPGSSSFYDKTQYENSKIKYKIGLSSIPEIDYSDHWGHWINFKYKLKVESKENSSLYLYTSGIKVLDNLNNSYNTWKPYDKSLPNCDTIELSPFESTSIGMFSQINRSLTKKYSIGYLESISKIKIVDIPVGDFEYIQKICKENGDI